MIKIIAALFLTAAFLFNINIFSESVAIADTAATADPSKAQLQQELDQLELQIAAYEQQLRATKTDKNTLSNKIKQLQAQQAELNLPIKKKNILVDNLDNEITVTLDSISAAQAKSDQLKQDISANLFSLYERDSQSLVASLAGDQGLSGFFTEVDNTQKLSQTLSGYLDQVKKVEQDLQTQNDQLQSQQQDAKNLLSLKALQSQNLNVSLNEQGTLLAATKGREDKYTQILTITKQRAAEIRNQIYDVIGVGRQVTFGEAMDIAVQVSKETGVRAAFLLAILTQESNLGKNVGTCNRPTDPPEKSWRAIMKPDRDQQPFVAITTDLGLDTNITPVSCPMHDRRGRQVGWGGAMGPAQFIPSTWLGYKDRVAEITGHPANPWDIHDGFIAAAILLKGNGATEGGENGEWKAAMHYFSGSVNPRFRFYGDNVLALARNYQSNIDALNQ